MEQIVYFLVLVIRILGSFFSYSLIARALLSIFAMSGMRAPKAIMSFVYDVTEPLLEKVRLLPHRIGMIDLSLLMALVFIDLSTIILLNFLSQLIQ